ncbi:MAG: alpha/beta hydrolase family protein [Oscillospiraceae bacterium]
MAVFRGDFASNMLGMNTSVSVIIPDAKPNCEMNVVYLLHGLSDNCSGWTRMTSIERYAIESNCIVVMPEVQRSFYADMKYGVKYFSYIAVELPAIMHKLFNVSIKRENTFIAGLSMGGYGALKCAFTFPEKYAGCAAFSSACDMQFNINENYISTLEIGELKAVYGNDLKIGDENDLFVLSTKANSSELKPRIMMTCGTQDFLYEQNVRMKAHIEALDFEYKYEEWEDEHTWRFWDASIQLAFDFFFDSEED